MTHANGMPAQDARGRLLDDQGRVIPFRSVRSSPELPPRGWLYWVFPSQETAQVAAGPFVVERFAQEYARSVSVRWRAPAIVVRVRIDDIEEIGP